MTGSENHKQSGASPHSHDSPVFANHGAIMNEHPDATQLASSVPPHATGGGFNASGTQYAPPQSSVWKPQPHTDGTQPPQSNGRKQPKPGSQQVTASQLFQRTPCASCLLNSSPQDCFIQSTGGQFSSQSESGQPSIVGSPELPLDPSLAACSPELCPSVVEPPTPPLLPPALVPPSPPGPLLPPPGPLLVTPGSPPLPPDPVPLVVGAAVVSADPAVSADPVVTAIPSPAPPGACGPQATSNEATSTPV